VDYALAALISIMLLGYEILWLKYFGSIMTLGPIPFLLPVIFFGGSLGALVLALSPRAAWIVRYSHEAAAAGVLLAFASVPYWQTRATAELNPLQPALAFGASILWGLAQTALVRGSRRPALMIAAGAAGALPLVALPALLNHFHLGLVAPVFAASQIFLLCVLMAGRKPLWRTAFTALAGIGMYLSHAPEPALGTYSNAITTLRIQETTEPPRSIAGSAAPGSEFHQSKSPFHNLRVYRNGRYVTDLIDVADLSEAGSLKQDELFRYVQSVKPGRAAIIGPGGGRDILYARLAGFGHITAIEINPNMVKAVRENSKNPDLAYGAPEVTTVVTDGRDYFRKLPDDQIFDLIMLSEVRSYGNTLSMHFAENYLFTDEAISSYVRHLAPGGMLLYRMTGRDNQYLSTHLQSAVNTLRDLPSGAADEVAISRRRKGADSRWNGFILALKKDGFRPHDKVGIRSDLAQREHKVRFLPTREMGERPVRRLTDDRPYPHRSTGSMLDIWAVFIALLGLIAFAVQSIPTLNDQRGLLSAGFLCGFTFVAVQVLAVEQGVFQSGDPFSAPPLVMAATLMFSGLGYTLALKANGKNQFLWAALSLIAAFTILKTIGHWPFGNLTRAALAAAAVGAPILFAARGFATLLQRAHQQSLTAQFIAANGFGMLLGGLGSKLIQVEAGATGLVLVCAITYIFARHQSAKC